jgi:hypothetical protein
VDHAFSIGCLGDLRLPRPESVGDPHRLGSIASEREALLLCAITLQRRRRPTSS